MCHRMLYIKTLRTTVKVDGKVIPTHGCYNNNNNKSEIYSLHTCTRNIKIIIFKRVRRRHCDSHSLLIYIWEDSGSWGEGEREMPMTALVGNGSRRTNYCRLCRPKGLVAEGLRSPVVCSSFVTAKANVSRRCGPDVPALAPRCTATVPGCTPG